MKKILLTFLFIFILFSSYSLTLNDYFEQIGYKDISTDIDTFQVRSYSVIAMDLTKFLTSLENYYNKKNILEFKYYILKNNSKNGNYLITLTYEELINYFIMSDEEKSNFIDEIIKPKKEQNFIDKIFKGNK